MTRAYRVTLIIVDHEQMGGASIVDLLESHELNPRSAGVVGVDIGEWTDDHPLNLTTTDVGSWFKYAVGKEWAAVFESAAGLAQDS